MNLINASKSDPHVVILGAGTSVAAFPNGDKKGRRLPTMDNFIEIVGLDELRDFMPNGETNLETIYSELYNTPACRPIITKVEQKIFHYFSNLELPDYPTLYDHLILALRSKDIIATFNWDPFLFKACERIWRMITHKVPKLFFLHGNVAIKVDFKNRKKLSIETDNIEAKKTPLLYPIKNKNYSDDPFIHTEWESVKHYLKRAYILTIFG